MYKESEQRRVQTGITCGDPTLEAPLGFPVRRFVGLRAQPASCSVALVHRCLSSACGCPPFLLLTTPVHQSPCLVVFDLSLLSPNQLFINEGVVLHFLLPFGPSHHPVGPPELGRASPLSLSLHALLASGSPLRSSSITAAFHASSSLLPLLYAFFLSTSSFHIFSLLIFPVLPTFLLINSALHTFGPSSLSVSS